MTYRYPETRKAHVRKATLFGDSCWEAGRPGFVYLMGEGWHFDRWEDAMAHATGTLDAAWRTCSCGTPGLNYAGPERDCPVHGEERWCESCECMVPVVDESIEQIGYEERAREVHVVHLDCVHDIVTEMRR